MSYTISWVVGPLVFVWVLVLAVFWLLRLLPWPPPARVSAFLDRWGSLELQELGGFSYGRLILVSAITLFLELLLIRWVSAEVRIFAYFKNLVLIGCFFGFGLGCYMSRRRIRLLYTILPLLALVVFMELPWQGLHDLMLALSDYIGGLADVHVWARYQGSALKLYLGAAVAFSVIIPLLTLVTIAMVPMGQMVARYLETSSAGISAYSANVAASVVGIWVFTGLCFSSLPPVAWFGALGAALLLLFWHSSRVRASIAVCFVLSMGLFLGGQRFLNYRVDKFAGAPEAIRALQGEETTHWSPYQKLTLTTLSDGTQPVRYILNTNGSWYQEIMNLSPQAVSDHPEYYNLEVPLPYHRYNFPYRFVDRPEDVLILGAGMGNDVAAALRNGAQRVVAVEIDPLIHKLGHEYHLEHPYSDPRVKAVIDDARSYVQNTEKRFDLIVSSILDSHITQSSFTNIRTDNYVYTREGLAQMKRLLKPGGVLNVSFSFERNWFAGRLQGLLTDISGRPPLMVLNGYMFFFVGEQIDQRIEQNAELRSFIESQPQVQVPAVAPTTDDWPYFYQRDRGIPFIVILLSFVLIGVYWTILRRTGLALRNLQWHFFFLGAGFMLMEVQIISKLALLFGTTWLINSIVISVLLALILLANATVARLPRLAQRIAYPGLFLTLVVSYWTPMQALLFPSLVLRSLVSTLLLCSPVYFAGLIFIASFARCRFQAEAFGSNLFGALVGGLLEALSFWTGIRSLLIVAALCYMLSALLRPSAARQRVVSETAPATATS